VGLVQKIVIMTDIPMSRATLPWSMFHRMMIAAHYSKNFDMANHGFRQIDMHITFAPDWDAVSLEMRQKVP